MKKRYILFAIFILLAILIVVLIFQSQEIKNKFKFEAQSAMSQQKISGNDILTEDDIKSLPEPVKKYIIYSGAVGKQKVHNMKITFDGQMKPDINQDWTNIKIQQYSFFDKPKRLFFIEGSKGGIPFPGMDSYINGKGNMLIKVLGLIKVVDAQGKEANASAAVTYFNDMCILAPGALTDSRIQWKSVDSHTASATFTDDYNSVSAKLIFNDKGELTDFFTDDRYFSPDGKSPVKTNWETPIKDYKDYNGVKICSYGEAIWHFKSSDFQYAKFNIKSVEYNCKSIDVA